MVQWLILLWLTCRGGDPSLYDPVVFQDDDKLPACMQPARDALAPNIVKLTVQRHKVDEVTGKCVSDSVDVTGVLIDPDEGEIVTFGDVLTDADRVSARFVGAKDERPRRTEVIGVDAERGIGLVRAGAIDLPGLARDLVPPSDLGPVFLTSFRARGKGTRLTSSAPGLARGRMPSGGLPDQAVIRLSVLGCDQRGPGGLVSTAEGRLVGLELPGLPAEANEKVERLAVPMAEVWAAVDEVRKRELEARCLGTWATPRCVRPWIGFSGTPVSDEALLHHLGIDGGIAVDEIYANSPLERAGIRPHHVLVAWNGRKLLHYCDLAKALRSSKVGDTIALTVMQCGQAREVALVLGAW